MNLSKKTYCVLGTGAIGGYCAAKLAQAGFEVHCLLRSDFQVVKESGLSILTGKEKITVKVNAYQHAHDLPKCDVILVSFKSTENSLLKIMLPKIMHKNSVIVLLQNGIGAEQELAKCIEASKIIGAICLLKVSKIAPGIIKHYSQNTIELAQYYEDPQKEGLTKVTEELATHFRKSGIESLALPNLASMRWTKLCGNLAMSGLSTVLNASIQEVVNNPASFSLLCEIIKEAISVAESTGAKFPENFYQKRIDIFKSFVDTQSSYSSMKEDFDAKRPLELHGIYENALEIAKKHNIAMPLTKMLYQQLMFLNERNLSKE